MEKPNVKIANFEGPFDVLLHLIKKNEMDIYNVEIYKITNQYLNFLEEMKEMDLEITSEFIVIAATLIEIKSKKLLPKIKVDEDNEEDVEKKLLEKLIEYRKIKNATLFFRDRYITSGEVYTKKPEIIEEVKLEKTSEDIFKNITLLDLYNIYNSLLENYRQKLNDNIVQRKIYIDKYKVEDKMKEVLEKIHNKNIIEFNELLIDSECKLETVVIFLALLELIKLREVKAYQDDSFGNILLKRRKYE
ncbi:segregation/condensation protein A [Clostridium carnis]